MEEPISARYEWNPEAMTEGLWVHQQLSIKPVFRFLLWGLILLAMIGSVAIPVALIALPPAFIPGIRRNAAIGLVVVLLFWGFAIHGNRSKRFLRWQARQAFRNLPKEARFVEWSITEDQLTNRTALTSSTFLWPVFLKVVESPAGFLLYQNTNFFNFIPGHGFASPEDVRRFSDFARARARNFVLFGECQFPTKPLPVGAEDF